MPEGKADIAICHACGVEMDVSALRPYTKCSCPSCGAESRIKREFGHYTLMRRHAEGGMSSVFGAHDNTLDREVAIKVLNTTYSSDEKRIAAFEHEAKLTASLSHPNIVKVYTTGKAYGCFYIAMEFVSGGHLEQIIRTRGKIPEKEMLKLAIEVAEGLRAAFDSGLLHRDIKPGNILLDSDGHAKLVDFGLSLVTQGGKATAEEIWATPYYVPPETIEGQEEDQRSDIHAFGCTLYHALAGQPPCSETTMATEKLRHAKRNVIPLSLADPSISRETAKVVDKAIAYEAENRFQSYEDLLSALKRSLSYANSGRHETTDRKQVRKALLDKKRKNQQVVTVSAIAVGVIVLLILFAVVTSRRPSKSTGNGDRDTSIDGNGSGNEKTAEELAKSYREARAALLNGENRDAAELFEKLLQRRDFKEPSRTMAGVEAVMAAYLDGNARSAHQSGLDLRDHLIKNRSGREAIRPSLSATLDKIDDFPAIPPPELGNIPGAQDVVATMLAGLKNWEQGMLEEGAKCFRSVTAIQLAEEDGWAAIYQDRARVYLRDYDLLSQSIFREYPATVKDCERAVDELSTILTQLETRGRARYNVKAWQADLDRHSKLLSSRN